MYPSSLESISRPAPKDAKSGRSENEGPGRNGTLSSSRPPNSGEYLSGENDRRPGSTPGGRKEPDTGAWLHGLEMAGRGGSTPGGFGRRRCGRNTGRWTSRWGRYVS